MDLVSSVFQSLRLSGAIFLRGEFTRPWAISAPSAPEMATLLKPERGRLLIFHIIAQGQCRIALNTGEARMLRAPSVVLMPHGQAHSLADSDCGSYKPVSELLPPVPWSELPVLSYGGGGEPAKIVCGYLHSSNTTVIPFLEEMPNFITFYFGDSARQTGLQAILDYMVQEAEEARPGAASLVFRAAELFFVEMIRRHADALSSRDQGWFGALHDPLMARALQLLHADPAYPWTVELLAQKAATSRSTLADRFKQRFG
ncbi:MAG: cupin domain-containing protein [Pseudolabrys sp.]